MQYEFVLLMKRLVTILYCFVALAVSVSASAALYPVDTVRVASDDSLLVNPVDTLDEWNLDNPLLEDSDTLEATVGVDADSIAPATDDSVAVAAEPLQTVPDAVSSPSDDAPVVKQARQAAPKVHKRSAYSAPAAKHVATEPKPVATEPKPVAPEPMPVVKAPTPVTAEPETVAVEQKAVVAEPEKPVTQKETKSNNSDYTMTIPIWLLCLLAVIIAALVALMVFLVRKVSYLRTRVAELKGEVMYLNNMRMVKRELESQHDVQVAPVVEPEAEPAVENVAEPVVENVAEPVVENVAEPVAEPEAVVVPANNKQVQLLIKNIEKHISEPELGVEQLAMSMDMSRSQLYNLCNELLGQTPAAFILDIRLKRAMQLIETRQYKMNEVSAKVGFTDAKYFAKVFKKKTGMTPSQYMERPHVN